MTSFIDDDGNALDYNGEDFSITRQIASFRNFKLKGDISVSFSLPNTSSNLDKLGYSSSNQINNPAFSKLPFNLMRNGNFSMRGVIVIQEDKGDDLDCVFISGNANWFRSLDFPCNEIVDDYLSFNWNVTRVNERRTATEGIIFPFVDYAFRHEKFDGKWFNFNQYVGTGNNIDVELWPVFPCLYVKTLVDELAIHGGIKIAGTLFQDALFKTIIITPEGPDLVDPVSGSSLSFTNGTVGGGLITIGSIAPSSIKAIDFIKWLCLSFGCIPTFDEFSQTLSLDLFDKIDKATAEDWSQYFVSNTSQYYKFFQHNLIHVAETDTEEIADYNTINADLKYGEADLESDKTDESVTEVYESPFPAVKDAKGTSLLKWACPYVEFYKLTDETAYTYTSVTNSGGQAQFNGAGFPFIAPGIGVVVRIADDAGIYSGFHNGSSLSAAGATTYTSNCNFISTSTGKIYVQSVEKKTGTRVLVCVPNIATAGISSQVTWNFFAIGNVSTVSSAFWSKPYYGYNALDLNKQGLSYGEINLPTYDDFTLTETHLSRINTALGNPPEQCYFLLPEAVQKSYNFNKFVYLKTAKLTGYFFVELMENYVDSTTPVRCTLPHVDG